MISYIIIGRNEGWKLTKCLKSVFDTIEYNKLRDAEVIYVDSKSTDDSIERAKTFAKVKIFRITGVCNAAIARNIGAKEAKGNILFFIDGDMEIDKNFIKQAIVNNQLKHDCVTGHLDDYLYDINGNYLGIKKRTYRNEIPDEEQLLKTNGGIFLIKKEVWDAVGGMRTKYRRSQDIDLSLRLMKNYYKIIRLPQLITKHHTIEYSNENRMWQNLKQGYFIFPPMIFRDHITTPHAWKRIIRSNYTEILLLLTILNSIIFNSFVTVITFLYLLFLLIRSCKHTISAKISKSKFLYFPQKILHHFINDVLFWVAFFFIYPKNKDIKYQLVK